VSVTTMKRGSLFDCVRPERLIAEVERQHLLSSTSNLPYVLPKLFSTSVELTMAGSNLSIARSNLSIARRLFYYRV